LGRKSEFSSRLIQWQIQDLQTGTKDELRRQTHRGWAP